MVKKQTKRKASAATKVFVVVFALVIVVLILLLVWIMITGQSAGAAGGTKNSAVFEANNDTYFENTGEIVSDGGRISFGGSAAALPSASPEPSASPDVTAAPSADSANADANGFLFPNSDTALITDEEMNQKLTDKEACRHAINEIYARRGYQFSNAEILAYFNQFSWYQSLEKETDMQKVDQRFNATEKANIEKLQQYKAAHGWN